MAGHPPSTRQQHVALLLAELVNPQHLPPAQRAQLPQRLAALGATLLAGWAPILRSNLAERAQADSPESTTHLPELELHSSLEPLGDDRFRLALQQPAWALRLALLLRLEVLDWRLGPPGRLLDLRLALGTGPAHLAGMTPSLSDRTAAQRAETLLPELRQQDRRLGLDCGNVLLNPHWGVLLLGLDDRIRSWSQEKVQAVKGLLLGHWMRDIGQHHGVKKQAIQQRAASARWPVVQAEVELFEQVLG